MAKPTSPIPLPTPQQTELDALILARDVLQRQIDERVTLRNHGILERDQFFKERKTKKLASFVAELGYRVLDFTSKEHSLQTKPAALLLYRIKEYAVPIFKKFVTKTCKKQIIPLDDLEPKVKTTFLQLCDAFERLKWIATERGKHEITICRLNDKEAAQFWFGGWAEVVNRSLVESTLQDFAKKHKCKFDIFFDVKLAKIESEKATPDMQLDIIAQLKDRFYIFETKTGILGIDKWVARAQMFSVDQKSRYITCCADETIPPYLFEPYTLLPLSQLKEQMTRMLKEDLIND